MSDLHKILKTALDRREVLIQKLHADATNCYRLFHGATEGSPGLSIDRYGGIVLAQTWRTPLSISELELIERFYQHNCDQSLQLVWNNRAREAKQPFEYFHAPNISPKHLGSEFGISYDVRPRHRGQDPLLFLDFRSARRKIMAETSEKTVLNLFAYTCGIGCCAVAGGATEALNVDFSASSLQIGLENAQANDLSLDRFKVLQQDVFPVVRQLAGLSVGGRRNKRPKHVKLEPRQFDVCVLDPPRWSTGKFGAVDVVNDYPSMFKPALLATQPGGRMLVTNNVASVDYSTWIEVLIRAAKKAGREIEGIDRIMPDEDFPSPDTNPPLKIAWLQV